MSDADYIIQARKLTKAYRLYEKPSERLFSLFRRRAPDVDGGRVHHALRGVDLDIRRGEKVAVIGRNGAGKSTLLKIITRAIEPTSGELDMRGKSHALLSLGAGFHPDFTGRENAHAFLAHMGVSGARADALVAKAVDFAEIEEYIDQPLKTYSTGMQARLMFAVSTALEPDLLVIDEVLGVGDAYFQNKSFDRIRELCDSKNATLLLVSHDIYSAAKLCPRVIWIDHGQILIDSDAPTVIRAYESSVREQEERRLRQKALGYAVGRDARARKERVVIEIQSRGNQPLMAPVWFSEIALLLNGTRIGSLPLGESAFDETGGARLLREGCNWSDTAVVDGRMSRALRNHGSAFHKIAGVIDVDDPTGSVAGSGALAVSADYRMEAPADLELSISTASRRVALGRIPASVGGWATHVGAEGGEAALPSAHDLLLSDWTKWTVMQPELVARKEGGVLTVAWNGASGPYLLMSPTTQQKPHDLLLLPISARVRSGKIGIGALDADGKWSRTYAFDGAQSHAVLEIPTGEDGNVRLVLYSAAADQLDADIALGDSVSPPSIDASVNTTGVYGAGDIRVEGFRVYNGEGRETLVLDVGKPARFEIDYRIVRAGLKERAQVLIAFQRDGVTDVLRLIQKAFMFDEAVCQAGTLVLSFDPLPLAPGAYAIPIVIGAEGYYDRPQELYFSINPSAYFVMARIADIKIEGAAPLYAGAGVVLDGDWRIFPAGKRASDAGAAA